MNELAQIAMTEDDARRLTERIRIAAVNYSEAKEKLLRLVSDAKEGAAHVSLGYKSWQAYLSEVLGEEPMRLTRDERPEVVQMLTTEGMTTRAIAPIVGVKSDQTVRADLSKLRDDHAVDEPRISHGMDGKTRVHQSRPVQPEPQPDWTPPVQQEAPKPKRRPLTDAAYDAGWDARKITERIERIVNDDRYARNQKEVATLLRGHLQYAVETYTDILDQLNSPEGN